MVSVPSRWRAESCESPMLCDVAALQLSLSLSTAQAVTRSFCFALHYYYPVVPSPTLSAIYACDTWKWGIDLKGRDVCGVCGPSSPFSRSPLYFSFSQCLFLCVTRCCDAPLLSFPFRFYTSCRVRAHPLPQHFFFFLSFLLRQRQQPIPRVVGDNSLTLLLVQCSLRSILA